MRRKRDILPFRGVPGQPDQADDSTRSALEECTKLPQKLRFGLTMPDEVGPMRWEAQAKEVQGGRGSMQMGPASLPTPLSPARGLSSCVRPKAAAFPKRLAPDVSPIVRQAGHPVPSPALAPASGSAPFAHPVRRPAPRQLGGSETGRSLMAVPLEARSNRRSSARSRRSPTGSSGRQRIAFTTLSNGALASSRSLLQVSLKGRADSIRRLIRVEKCPGFRSLDRHPERLSCPSDDLRLRPQTESGKLRNPDFSTFHGFRCGHGWISQRLVATRPFILTAERQSSPIALRQQA